MIKLAGRGVVPKWLRGRIANALFAGSIPADASTVFFVVYLLIINRSLTEHWPSIAP